MAERLPSNFKRIRLELAREPAHPEGDSETGYTMLAPLLPDGLLDVDSAKHFKDKCKVIRFRRGEEAAEGFLRRKSGGWWAFHYDFAEGGEDDDPAFKFEKHRFVTGDYVTVIEDEGAHTYRVAAVDSV